MTAVAPAKQHVYYVGLLDADGREIASLKRQAVWLPTDGTETVINLTWIGLVDTCVAWSGLFAKESGGPPMLSSPMSTHDLRATNTITINWRVSIEVGGGKT